MRVGVPRETAAGEHRVALVPDAIARLEGITVAVERGAGAAAGFPDDAYAEAGAELVDDAWQRQSTASSRSRKPSDGRGGRKLASGQVLIAFLAAADRPRRRSSACAAQGVLAFAMESIPRMTRAQSMDALSSQATVAGYKAVLLAADRAAAVLPDADDRGRHDRAGAGARARRRRRRPAGDRDRAPARRGRLRLRRAARPCASRCSRSARPSSTSASSARRPRAATRAS